MTDEIPNKREQALELVRHPLNRAYFQRVVSLLRDGGTYGFVAMEEVFTKEELQKALEVRDEPDANR